MRNKVFKRSFKLLIEKLGNLLFYSNIFRLKIIEFSYYLVTFFRPFNNFLIPLIVRLIKMGILHNIYYSLTVVRSINIHTICQNQNYFLKKSTKI